MVHHSLADSESGRGIIYFSIDIISGIMKLLVLVLCCIGSTFGDSQAEASDISSSNKLSSSKSSLNSIPSAPAQKTTLIQQSHQPIQQSQSHQYIPQYVVQKQVVPQQQQPAAMFIIAQPGHQGGHQSPLFQQAVQQLLSYYSNNPQAKYQLLQQQGGLPQGGLPQGGLSQGGLPQGGLQQSAQQPQVAYHQQGLPSGALHVIPSPQLESQNVQQVASPPAGPVQHQTPQATYIIPAQSQQILSGLNPALLAQFAAQIPQPQHTHIPIQFAPQQVLAHAQPYQPQLNSGHFLAQQIPQFAQQAPQYVQQPQFPQGHYALAPQFATGLGQAHIQQLPANIQLGSTAQAQVQGQFGAKQQVAQNANDYSAQTEKSHQASSSSSYNPIYRTAYVKG